MQHCLLLYVRVTAFISSKIWLRRWRDQRH